MLAISSVYAVLEHCICVLIIVLFRVKRPLTSNKDITAPQAVGYSGLLGLKSSYSLNLTVFSLDLYPNYIQARALK